MYNLESYSFGSALRKARKLNELSIEDFAIKLGKSPSTIYKYETNLVIPDFKTVLDICNALDISLDDLYIKDETDNMEATNNPFLVNTLYMYHIDSSKKLYEMKLEIVPRNGIMNVYFKVPTLGNKIFYSGIMESNSDICFLSFRNYCLENLHFERILIFVNINHAVDNIKMGMIFGEKDNTYAPTIKKVGITMKPLTERQKEKIIKRLKITERELQQVEKDGYWYPDIANAVGY